MTTQYLTGRTQRPAYQILDHAVSGRLDTVLYLFFLPSLGTYTRLPTYLGRLGIPINLYLGI